MRQKVSNQGTFVILATCRIFKKLEKHASAVLPDGGWPPCYSAAGPEAGDKRAQDPQRAAKDPKRGRDIKPRDAGILLALAGWLKCRNQPITFRHLNTQLSLL